jgi:PleD family two-component response regulator
MNAQATADSAARGSAPANGAQAVADERPLCVAVAGRACDSLRPGVTVTISIGVVDRAAYSSGAEMLAAADARLYEAKRAGRNCVR